MGKVIIFLALMMSLLPTMLVVWQFRKLSRGVHLTIIPDNLNTIEFWAAVVILLLIVLGLVAFIHSILHRAKGV